MRVFAASLLVVFIAAACSGPGSDVFGADLYSSSCAHCRGSDLAGGIGPPLGPGSNAAILTDEQIIECADGVMVARGDLGIDCPIEDLPHLQKSIVRQCVEYGIPAITATQMLESMVSAPSPTRAEVTDVANAIFDGTDALMLSGETAIGHDPVLVVETMDAIAARAEAEGKAQQLRDLIEELVERADIDTQVSGSQLAIPAASLQDFADQQFFHGLQTHGAEALGRSVGTRA